MKKMVIAISLLSLCYFAYGSWTDHEVSALAQARREAILEIVPAIKKFRDDKARYPQTLDELVPTYSPSIARALQSNPETDPVLQIRFQSSVDSARFIYHVSREPGSSEVYDVTTNAFWRNR